jgi:hypothetical protein
VERLCRQFLAGPGFACNKNGSVNLSDIFDQAIHFLHHRTGVHKAMKGSAIVLVSAYRIGISHISGDDHHTLQLVMLVPQRRSIDAHHLCFKIWSRVFNEVFPDVLATLQNSTNIVSTGMTQRINRPPEKIRAFLCICIIEPLFSCFIKLNDPQLGINSNNRITDRTKNCIKISAIYFVLLLKALGFVQCKPVLDGPSGKVKKCFFLYRLAEVIKSIMSYRMSG